MIHIYVYIYFRMVRFVTHVMCYMKWVYVMCVRVCVCVRARFCTCVCLIFCYTKYHCYPEPLEKAFYVRRATPAIDTMTIANEAARLCLVCPPTTPVVLAAIAHTNCQVGEG